MSQTYRAILSGDRLQWKGEAPVQDRPMDVYITVADQTDKNAKAGMAMAAALQTIADRGGLPDLRDAAAWQRQIRIDHAPPGRDGVTGDDAPW